MRTILLGAPGAGKGTQAVELSKKYSIPHISTGDIFRSNIKEGTALGQKAKEFIDKGQLVPDELTIEIVKDRLLQEDCKNGFILDGFPRTIPQAEYLEKALEEMSVKLDGVINIFVEDSVIIKRMTGRSVCSSCGISYNTVSKPTSVEGVCDSCGGATVQREDDKEETVIKRLEAYHKQTEPLIDFYKERGLLYSVSGKEDVALSIKNTLEVAEKMLKYGV